MIVQYIPRRNLFTTIKYGLLYNWYAATAPQTVEYGYLYNWYAASDARNMANTGWHVPTRTEFQTLQTYLGGASVSGGKLKETGTTYWDSPNTGATNEVGFNGRGSGFRTSSFSVLKQSLYLWSSTEYYSAESYAMYIIYNSAASNTLGQNKYYGMGVRLMKDSTTLTHGQTGTYTGNDGRVYQTICIGTQEWLSENLMETKYRNGDAIPEVTDNTAWAALTTGARCAYNNTITNVGLGNAITSSDDWVVPTEINMQVLVNYLGGTLVAGGYMKETGTTYWDSPNTNADNLSGFNGRGAGNKSTSSGQSINLKSYLFLWTSTAKDAISSYYRRLSYNSSSVNGTYGNDATNNLGASLRLLYTGVGTPTSYTGNDGKKYRVVTIGTQTWLADNLAETKYRDGSYISGYDGGVYTTIADATWAALTTGALCAYNNDTNNI